MHQLGLIHFPIHYKDLVQKIIIPSVYLLVVLATECTVVLHAT